MTSATDPDPLPRVLMLSGEQLLVSSTEPELNDAQARHIEMGLATDCLQIVVWSKDASRPAYPLSERVAVHPVSGRGKLAVFLGLLGACRRCVARERLNVITVEDPFLFGLVGLYLQRRFDVALNVQLHADVLGNPYWIRERPVIRRFLDRLGRYVIRRADSVRVVSRVVEKTVLNERGSDENIYRVPTGGGVEIPRFRATFDTDRPKPTLSEGPTVLSVGRLAVEKDYPTLIKAAQCVKQHLPNVRFVIVGEGEDRTMLETEIASLSLSETVRLEGFVPNHRLPDYYAEADVFILTSLYEGMGRVLIEAAAAGLPIVSTDVGIAREVFVHGRDGYLVPKEDPEALARSISELLSDTSLLQRFREAARDRDLAQFSRSIQLPLIGAMWKETLRQHAGRSS